MQRAEFCKSKFSSSLQTKSQAGFGAAKSKDTYDALADIMNPKLSQQDEDAKARAMQVLNEITFDDKKREIERKAAEA